MTAPQAQSDLGRLVVGVDAFLHDVLPFAACIARERAVVRAGWERGI